jgi:hypothetical protein
VFYSEEPSGEAHTAAGAEFRSVAQAPVADGPFKTARELQVLQQLPPMAREDRPDCVVYDSMSLWGWSWPRRSMCRRRGSGVPAMT